MNEQTLTEDELKAIVDAFRCLRQWRDEAAARAEVPKTGTDGTPLH